MIHPVSILPSKTKLLFFYFGGENFRYGVAQVYLHVLNGLDKTRFEPYLVVTGRLASPIHGLSEEVNVVELNKPGLKKSLFSYVATIRRINPDVIVSAMEHPNVISVLARWLSGVKAKLILTSHGVLSARIAHMWEKKEGLIISTAVKMLYPFADHLVGVSRYVRDDLLKFTNKLPPSSVIYNPVFPEGARREILPAEKEKGLIVTSSRLAALKCIDEAVRALQYLDEGYRLVVLGDGPELTRLQTLVGQLGLKARVEFAGYVDDPFYWYRLAEILVLPSMWEGFGNVLIEAMSCGCQIVANSQAGAPSEVLCNGEYGFLYEGGNAESLANNVFKARSEPKERQSLINYASKFTDVRVARQYEQLFDSLLMNP